MTGSNDNGRTVLVCLGTGCVSSGSIDIYGAIEAEVKKAGLEGINVKFTGCHGFCQRGPIVIIEPEGVFYSAVKEKDVPEIVESHLKNNKPVEHLFYRDPVADEPVKCYKDIPFYAGQERIVLKNCGHINPEVIEDSINAGVYRMTEKVLHEMTPEDVIETIKKSGLRGRGGAGFPAAIKWKFCRDEKADQKYIICNADEGDPGAFMDGFILEANPHQVIEGMIIAGYAIGATKGFIYVRAEYPLAVKRLYIAVSQARERGFLGDNIAGSDFSFDLKIFQGAGAFVCGEETGLIASIEGSRGMPRTRPPFPAQRGLWGRPTIINNVKTLSYIPEIINKGADWFAGIGTEKSPGTAVFALTGKVVNSGLIEVPMGTTLREIIFVIGGGIPDGKKFKAVQTGGPSGGCIPSEFLDMKVDFDELAKVGSIMGSGGMVVMDEDSCMVDIARYFLSFTEDESCGKCTPCRMGTQHVLRILNDITEGNGKPEDIDTLEKLCRTIKDTSLCGLGQTAPNPVLTTIEHFRDEYEAHINEGRCPALACKALLTYAIDAETCKSCGLCKKDCPTDAITGSVKPPEAFVIHEEKCIRCGMCFSVCPFGSVQKSSGNGETQVRKSGSKNNNE